jgi:hypothetical protein
MLEDHRQYAPATQRNRKPILSVLSQILAPVGNVLEISSGTGEHAIFFAEHLNGVCWIPSDLNPIALQSIEAWRIYSKTTNVESPLSIDVNDSIWQIENLKTDIMAIVNINMIHIAPWSSCLGLLNGAWRILKKGGILYLYGPFKKNGEHTAASNLAFDQSLREQNEQWGVRDLEMVIEAAKNYSLELMEIIEMPANNLSVVFRRN